LAKVLRNAARRPWLIDVQSSTRQKTTPQINPSLQEKSYDEQNSVKKRESRDLSARNFHRASQIAGPCLFLKISCIGIPYCGISTTLAKKFRNYGTKNFV
jgi:hypothetical protein